MASSARLRGRSDVVLFGGCVLLSLIALALPASSRDPVAGALRTTVIAPLVGLQHGAQRWRGAWQERDRQTFVLDSLALRAMQAQALISENEQLRKLMGLAKRLETGFIPAEALRTSDQTGIVTSVVLSAGSNAGVRRYTPVIAPEGLVGTVVTAEPTMSTANLYTNPDFRASAMTADGSAVGIVHPHLENVLSREGGYMMELRDIPARITLQPGTPIITSGWGGTIPRGIPVGTVVRQLSATEGLQRTYLLSPAVNLARLTGVLILTPQRAAQGVGNIWVSSVSLDSATSQIVAGADSVQRAVLLLEERAKRAVLDSVKRTTIDSVLRMFGLPAGLPIDSLRARVDAQASERLGAPLAPGATGGVVRPPVVRPRPDTLSRFVRDSIRADSIRRDSIRRAIQDTTAAWRPPVTR